MPHRSINQLGINRSIFSNRTVTYVFFKIDLNVFYWNKDNIHKGSILQRGPRLRSTKVPRVNSKDIWQGSADCGRVCIACHQTLVVWVQRDGLDVRLIQLVAKVPIAVQVTEVVLLIMYYFFLLCLMYNTFVPRVMCSDKWTCFDSWRLCPNTLIEHTPMPKYNYRTVILPFG